MKLYVCFSSIYIIYIIYRVLSKEMNFFLEWKVGRLKKGMDPRKKKKKKEGNRLLVLIK